MWSTPKYPTARAGSQVVRVTFFWWGSKKVGRLRPMQRVVSCGLGGGTGVAGRTKERQVAGVQLHLGGLGHIGFVGMFVTLLLLCSTSGRRLSSPGHVGGRVAASTSGVRSSPDSIWD